MESTPNPAIRLFAVNVRTYRDALKNAVELPITTRGVLYVLAQWMNTDGTNAFVSQEKLAAHCQLTKRAVAGHLAAAVKAGYLHRTARGHSGQVATYRACVPDYRIAETGKGGNLVQPLPIVCPDERRQPRAAKKPKGCNPASKSLQSDVGKGGNLTSERVHEVAALPRTTSVSTSEVHLALATQAPDASPSGEPENDDISVRMTFVEKVLGPLRPDEQALAEGMLRRGATRTAVTNTIHKRRRELEPALQHAAHAIASSSQPAESLPGE